MVSVRKFADDFQFSESCAGEHWPAAVPDGECADAADRQRARGLRDGESSVHPQRGLAAVAGSGLQCSGTPTHTFDRIDLNKERKQRTSKPLTSSRFRAQQTQLLFFILKCEKQVII